LAEESSNLVGNSLCADKDKDLVFLVLHNLLEMLDHAVTLLHLCDNLNNLSNSVVGSELHGTDVDLDELLEEVRCKSTDLLRPCSGPHQSLSVRSNLANDFADLGLETHVKHAISLIEDKVCDTTKVCLASLKHIDQATRSGNAHFDSTREITDLGTLGNTTIDTGVADARRSAELLHLLLNLNSQLTGRSEDEDNRTIARSKERLGVDVDDGGKTVCKGLSGTSLGNTNDIATGEGHGPTLRLNGGRSREALGLDLIHDISGEASLVEGLNGARDILASNGHLVLAAEGFHISIRSATNVGVLLVEGLLELGKGAEIEVLILEASTESAHTVTTGTSSETTTTASVAAASETATAAAVATSVASTSVTTTTTVAVTAVTTITAITTTAVATASTATTAAVSAVVAGHYCRERKMRRSLLEMTRRGKGEKVLLEQRESWETRCIISK
jgi:hypothetical protein